MLRFSGLMGEYLLFSNSCFPLFPLIPLNMLIFSIIEINVFLFCAPKCHTETEMVSSHTCWGGIFRCRRTSAAGWVGAGPSRCSAAPPGRALRLPTHTDAQSRRSGPVLMLRGYPPGCLPQRLSIRCTCRQRRSPLPQGGHFHHGETPPGLAQPLLHRSRTGGGQRGM